MVSMNGYCYFSISDLSNSSEPLLLIVGSENVLFPGFQTSLLQPNAFLRKPSFLGLSVATGQTIGMTLLYMIWWWWWGGSIWNIFKVTDYNNYIYFILTLHWEV